MRALGAGIVVLVLAAGCGGPNGPGTTRDVERLSVEEAVYRFQFADDLGLPAGPLTYCLARTTADDLRPWTDPPAELLGRFRDHTPPVKTVSLCRMNILSGATDVETGGPAVIFRVAPPVWESDTEAVVDGGHHVNGLNGSGKTYRVRFQGGAWVVVDAQWRWIS